MGGGILEADRILSSPCWRLEDPRHNLQAGKPDSSDGRSSVSVDLGNCSLPRDDNKWVRFVAIRQQHLVAQGENAKQVSPDRMRLARNSLSILT